MKKTLRIFLAGFSFTFAVGFLARLWLTHTEIFPTFPAPLAEWLVLSYGAKDAEEIGDLEILIGLFLSFIIVSVLTLSGRFIWKKIQAATDKK